MYPIHFFRRAARRWPEAIAVEGAQESITYGRLAAEVEALASGLQSIDPMPGSRVGLCCFNDVEHVVAWLAVLAAGKVWVPLYPNGTAREISRLVEFTGASIVITANESRQLFDGVATSILISDPAGGPGTTGGLRRQWTGRSPRDHHLPLDATQAIKFTGGTTGRPKGVMQPYRAWNANIITQIMSWKLAPGERFLAAAPISHGTSTYILPMLASGGTIVLLDRPRPAETLHQLQNAGITTTFVPPTVLYMLMELPGVRDADYSSLRNVVYGGGPMRPEAIAKAQDIFGPCIASTYGQTEAPQIATMISAEELCVPDKRASVGRETLLTQVAIMDPDGELLPTGETGEIVIRGDLLMTGYWNEPEITAATIVDGWLHTGDLGLVDEDGFLFIRGRNKDMIITGGFNVYPADVEPTLGEHPDVLDCAVFGIPDEKWGEAVHAAVQLAKDASATPEELVKFVKERLGSVKAPKTIVVYDAIPRNQLGKLQKDVLVQDFVAGGQSKARRADS